MLLGWMGCASAQSLGTPAASGWIGQPLEMTVPARFNADSGDECVHADVFYGDHRLPAPQVRATVIGTQDNRRVRIEAQAPVDEPIVTVSLRAGCRNTVTRSYTLLPDMPSESVLAAAARPAFAVAGGPAMAAAAAMPSLRMDVPRGGPVAVPRVRPAAPAVVAVRDTPMPQARRPRSQAPMVLGGARLRLDPVEIDARTVLRVSATLADPGGDAARRATAALLWQAINADPSELLRTSAMLQKLEGDLAQLRQTANQTRTDMTALRQRLDEAQPWYASPALLQVLALLVLAVATGAAVLWYRTRHAVPGSMPWFEPQRREPADSALDAGFDASHRSVDVVLPQAAHPDTAEKAVPVVAAPASKDTRGKPAKKPAPGLAPRIETPAVAAAAQPQPQPSAARRPATGALRVETLAATFEEVEFLASLGLTSDAMDVLKAYLQDSASPAPIAFFELMRLCEQAEDAGAIPTIRRRYAQAFGVEAPRLEQVTAPVGLEGMKDLSERITAAWGRPEALDLIAEGLFAVPPARAPLTLQAGRDLICLYDLALARVADNASPQAQSDQDAHPLAPWAHSDDPHAAMAHELMPDAEGGHQFGLDVDLTAAPEPLPESQDPDKIALELAPLLEELQEQARRNEKARAAQQEEDAFSAAVASERAPISRY